MSGNRLQLLDPYLIKASRYMRALRRAVLAYWYATVEDPESAAIEATNATFLVNILDEAVFQVAHGDAYTRLRADDRLGRVVMGLELVRNCETHANVVFNGLLIEDRRYGVPLASGRSLMRCVYEWAAYDNLPKGYRELPSSATEHQQRARPEAQGAYRKGVQRRHVIETLFEAMAFFQSLDCRLVAPPSPERLSALSVCELERSADSAGKASIHSAWPMGADHFEVFLPDLACRSTERRSATWPPADQTIKELAKRARKRKHPPLAQAREVLHSLVDDSEKLIGYSGYTTGRCGHRSAWVERERQVWRDVQRGYRYLLVNDGIEVAVRSSRHQKVEAVGPGGNDLLAVLPRPGHPPLDYDTLLMVEEYDDLYLRMRGDE